MNSHFLSFHRWMGLIVLALSLFPKESLALSELVDWPSGGGQNVWEYKIVEDGACITNAWYYNPQYPTSRYYVMENGEIPSHLGGLPVVEIGDNALRGSGFTKFSIPDTVKRIGVSSIRGYGNYSYSRPVETKELLIPDSVESIGKKAFDAGTGFERIVIGNSVTNIGSYAFEGCKNVKEIVMGDGVEFVGTEAFLYGSCTNVIVRDVPSWVKIDFQSSRYWLSNPLSAGTRPQLIVNGRLLEDLVVPEGVTKIGMGSFANYTNLLSVSFPRSLETIGEGAFYECLNLRKLEIADVASWCKVGQGIGRTHVLYISGSPCKHLDVSSAVAITNSFEGCLGVETLSVGGNCKSLNNAFRYCYDLKSAVIGGQCEDIGDSFYGCTNLSYVVFEGPPPAARPFFGIANDAYGFYPSSHKDEWNQQISYGKWNGLTMIEGHRPVLKVKTADPQTGSITLEWLDGGAVNEGTTYSIYRSAAASWTDADRVTNGLATTEWTDENYWRAEPVLSPLHYWVVAENDHFDIPESNRVETRHRFALSVGVGEYEEGLVKRLIGYGGFDPSPDRSDISYAQLFGQLALEKGGCSRANVLTGTGARLVDIRREMRELGELVQTGDFVVIFCSSHGDGGFFGTSFKGIVMYDDTYSVPDLKSDLDLLFKSNNGVSVAFILNACLSGGAVQATPSSGPVAWITSSGATEKTPTWVDTIGTPLPKFVFDYGWSQGKGGGMEYLTFRDLTLYAMPAMSAFLSRVRRQKHPVVLESGILSHFIAGVPGTPTHDDASAVPSGLNATMGGEEVVLTWNHDDSADYFLVERTGDDGANPVVFVLKGNSDFGRDVKAPWYGEVCNYRLASMNEWGISDWSDSVSGSRRNKVAKWVAQKRGLDDTATPAALASAAATPSLNGATYEACYISGLDPDDPTARFESRIDMVDGDAIITPSPNLGTNRVYTVEGRASLSNTNEVWHMPDENSRFFRVKVALPE